MDRMPTDRPAPPLPPPPSAALLEQQGWTRPSTSNFLDHVGPVWTRTESGRLRMGVVVEEKHDNTQGRSHGGMIMTLCDEGMGRAAQAAREGERLFTVGFECQFIAGARHGEFMEVHCEVVRSTASLVFMRSTCFVGDRVVATAAGIWKVLSR
jgi:acyl-coenzyme A thioesterase PaaI-like protein